MLGISIRPSRSILLRTAGSDPIARGSRWRLEHGRGRKVVGLILRARRDALCLPLGLAWREKGCAVAARRERKSEG